MEVFGEHRCRLCLRDVSEGNVEEIKDFTMNILNVLLLKLNFDNRGKHVMCNVCSLHVLEAFEFKLTCLYTNDVIIPYVDETGSSVDLREIYAKENETEELNATSDDHKICRLCMQLISGEFKSVREIEDHRISKYIPEVNLVVVRDPVVCGQCFDSFTVHSTFINNCLQVEEMIRKIPNKEAFGMTPQAPSLGSKIETAIEVKFEGTEQEAEFIESDLPTSEDEEMSIKVECTEIKSEQNDTRSDTRSETPSRRFEHSDRPEVRQSKRALDVCSLEYAGTSAKPYKEPLMSCQIYSEIETYERFEDNDPLTEQQSLERFKARVHEYDMSVYKLKKRRNLTRHDIRQAKMSKLRMYKCFVCGFDTIYKGNLEAHVLKHDNVPEMKMYECDVCDFKTKNKGILTVHGLKHRYSSVAQTYRCDACNFQTKYKANFRKHWLMHHDLSFVEMFKCDRCDYEAMDAGSLTRHQIRHRDPSERVTYTCHTCGYESWFKGHFKNHLLRHGSQLRPASEAKHKCDVCNYETNNKMYLKKHKLRHRNERIC